MGDLVRARSMTGGRPVRPSRARAIRIGREEESRFAQGLGFGLLLSMPFWLAMTALFLLR